MLHDRRGRLEGVGDDAPALQADRGSRAAGDLCDQCRGAQRALAVERGILGHEPMGVVEEVGADVKNIAPGDESTSCVRPVRIRTGSGRAVSGRGCGARGAGS